MANADDEHGVIKALEITELLEKVLNYVPNEDLKNARAVAKLWRDVSLDNFRSGWIYVVDPETEAKGMLQLTVGIDANGGLLSEQKASLSAAFPPPPTLYVFEDNPFKKYRLMGPLEFPPPTNIINYAIDVGFRKMRYFWEGCAPHLTYLDLKGGSFFYKSTFIDGLIWLLKACPNLEELGVAPDWYLNPFSNETERQPFEFESVCVYNGYDILKKLKISKKNLLKMRSNLSPKVKSLSIEMPNVIQVSRQRNLYDLIEFHGDRNTRQHYVSLWTCMFSLMPNLESLSIKGLHYFYVMHVLPQNTPIKNRFIQLTSFEYIGEKISLWHNHFSLVPLLKYLDLLKKECGSKSLKNLVLMKINFHCFYSFPTACRNVLFRIRKTIETLSIGLRYKETYDTYPPQHYMFDLFNFIFPNLTDLTLELDCQYKSSTSITYENFLFLDFSVFRGTPNLTRFKMEYLHVPDKDWLRRRLTADDLQFGEGGPKWYETEGARVGADNESLQGINPLEGDGNETFDFEEENEIVLERMKEFYFTGRFTTEALLLLGEWMKNLKEFAAIFDEETIFIPFVVWPGTLKKLTVLEASFEGGGLREIFISNLRKMYPETEIVVEGQVDIPLQQLQLEDEEDDEEW